MTLEKMWLTQCCGATRWHYVLYMRKTEGQNKKYDPKWQATSLSHTPTHMT